ncbi:aldo/keto reductase [Desulforhabdus sp. TSK]|uniref:aldo/keto reductase n=1 Tax=Desulforhabdus sp. TSK TaxID=2925014 RepID=UPI001FC8CA36|nr:aldo/keto reductase [Desulforhabdus sp. TSK]GKT10214.1 aldo/keto reductase [Desulforhabdus sp. TSK]
MTEKKELSRRDFFRTAGALGTGSLLAAREALAQNKDTATEEAGAHETVPLRPFGKTGVQVSSLSLGGMFDIPSNQLLLKQALNWGVTYWDTADCYGGGKSEAGMGQFFKKYPESRAKVFLVSKSDARDPDGMTALLNQSLGRLNTDFIDLYFLHGVSGIRELAPAMKAWAEKAKADKKIKFFGFSTHSNMEDCMLGAAELGWIDGIMMSYNFRNMHQDKMKKAVDACVRAGIGLTAMKTQGGGPVGMDSETELELAGRFLKQGFTDKQARLKAVWENPAIASICSQMPTMTILMSNVAAALNRTELSAEDLRLMERYAQETASSYCAGCATLCETAVGGAVPIRDVMRCLMYYNSYGEHERARRLFGYIPSEVRLCLSDLDYTAAEQNCPQRLRIGKLMREAAALLA